jgi:hypothetical protein
MLTPEFILEDQGNIGQESVQFGINPGKGRAKIDGRDVQRAG